MFAERAGTDGALASHDASDARTLEEARAAAQPVTIGSRPPFAGFSLAVVGEQVRTACELVVPTSLAAADRMRDIVVYALHRFTSATLADLADAVDVGIEIVAEAIERARVGRLVSLAWQRMLWGVEWALRWRLRAAPHRP